MFLLPCIVIPLSHLNATRYDMEGSCSPQLRSGQGVRMMVSVGKVAFLQPKHLLFVLDEMEFGMTYGKHVGCKHSIC